MTPRPITASHAERISGGSFLYFRQWLAGFALLFKGTDGLRVHIDALSEDFCWLFIHLVCSLSSYLNFNHLSSLQTKSLIFLSSNPMASPWFPGKP